MFQCVAWYGCGVALTPHLSSAGCGSKHHPYLAVGVALTPPMSSAGCGTKHHLCLPLGVALTLPLSSAGCSANSPLSSTGSSVAGALSLPPVVCLLGMWLDSLIAWFDFLRYEKFEIPYLEVFSIIMISFSAAQVHKICNELKNCKVIFYSVSCQFDVDLPWYTTLYLTWLQEAASYPGEAPRSPKKHTSRKEW